MNRQDLVNKLTLTLGSQRESRELIDKFINEIKKTLRQNERVVISQFGSFQVHLRKGRELYNPYTGTKMRIPARRVVRFCPSKNILD